MSYENDIEHIMAVTAFKDRDTAVAAHKTLIWLENGAPHQIDGIEGTIIFDMSEFIFKGSCKTNACLAGTIELFRNESLRQYLKETPSLFRG